LRPINSEAPLLDLPNINSLQQEMPRALKAWHVDSWGQKLVTYDTKIFNIRVNETIRKKEEYMTRIDGRTNKDLRDIKITRGWLDHAEGSVLVEFGKTRVLCVASFTPGVPRWLKDSGKGWVTSEYSMLPRATQTRTAAITGAYVALADAINWAQKQGHIKAGAKPLSDSVAAVSVGIIDGVPMLDLCYEEDVRAETDMNVVCSGEGRFIEVQGTAEGAPFDRALLDSLLDLALAGCADLTALQNNALSK
jgi:ribonuclease PH